MRVLIAELKQETYRPRDVQRAPRAKSCRDVAGNARGGRRCARRVWRSRRRGGADLRHVVALRRTHRKHHDRQPDGTASDRRAIGQPRDRRRQYLVPRREASRTGNGPKGGASTRYVRSWTTSPSRRASTSTESSPIVSSTRQILSSPSIPTPHVDQYETGVRAAHNLMRLFAGRSRADRGPRQTAPAGRGGGDEFITETRLFGQAIRKYREFEASEGDL